MRQDGTQSGASTIDLPGLLQVADDLAAGRRQDTDTTLQLVVAGLREHLGMDVAFVGVFEGGQRRIRTVAERPDAPSVLPVDTCDPLEESYCARVADGRTPEFIPDARYEPSVADLPVTTQLPVGTHLSVPIRLSDGTVYGTLCGFTREPDPQLQARELGVLRLVARLLATHLERESRPGDELAQDRTRVRGALDERPPAIALQPVLALEDLRVVGFEALARFPDGRPPDGWFALAATVGLGVELELVAVRAALRRLPDLPSDAYLAVNASAAAVCSESMGELVEDLDDTVLARVVVELTEQTGVPDYDVLRERLSSLRERGARVAVDDAGTGYAGLHRILELSPDLIKLDRLLVDGVAADEVRQSLVSALTWFARRSGAQIVAEGIEREADARVLRRLGVPFGQGHLLGQPVLTR